MTIRFGNLVFREGHHQLELGAQQRHCHEYQFNGLDGRWSVDTGKSVRKLRQRGTLLARSEREMESLLAAIGAMTNRPAQRLWGDGRDYGTARMDSVKVGQAKTATKISCDYVIEYTQMSEG